MKGTMGKNRSRFGVWKAIFLNLGIVLFAGIFLQNCQKNISNAVVSWGKPTLVIPDVVADDGVVSPVAVDALGNGFIVWIRSEGERKSLWTKAYTPSQGWKNDIQIALESSDFLDVQIAMNSIGDGIVLWSQFDEGKTRIQANTYESELGWGTATPIQMVSENASSPQITLDKMGGGIAVWAQGSGDLGSIHAAFYRKGKGWDPSIRVSTGTGDTDDPQISMNESGNAVVVWQQSDGTDYK
ncbi:MAG: hypothetical protein VST69_06330, partial [Nitrospirota bacterium]|nr:hypothetical protein [Nitrospirota bacterium]